MNTNESTSIIDRDVREIESTWNARVELHAESQHECRAYLVRDGICLAHGEAKDNRASALMSLIGAVTMAEDHAKGYPNGSPW